MTFPFWSVGLEWHALARRAWPLRLLLLAGCTLALPVAGYALLGHGLLGEIRVAQEQRATLQAQWQAQSVESESLGDRRARVRDLEDELQRSQRRLFVDDGLAGLLQGLGAQGEGLSFEHVAVQGGVERPHYSELPIDVRAVGGFPALLGFLANLAAMDRLVTLEEAKLKPLGDALDMHLRLQAYRATQSDIQAQAQAPLAMAPRDPFVASGGDVAPLEGAVMVGHLAGAQGRIALVRVDGELVSLRQGGAFGPERVDVVDERRVELALPGQAPRVLHLKAVTEG